MTDLAQQVMNGIFAGFAIAGVAFLVKLALIHHRYLQWSKRCEAFRVWVRQFQKRAPTKEELVEIRKVLEQKNPEMRGPWERL